MTKKERAAARYEKMKSEGRCVQCGEPALSDNLRCAECRDRDRLGKRVAKEIAKVAAVLVLTACGSPFSSAVGTAGSPDGSELAQGDGGLDSGRAPDAAAPDSGTTPDGGMPGADSGQADSGGDAKSAGGSPGAGGAEDSGSGGAAAGGTPGAGGAGSGGAGTGGSPGGAPGAGGTAAGGSGTGGSGTGGAATGGSAGTGGSGPCEAALCPAVLEDGSDCKSRCCTSDGKCGCGGGICAPVGECTRVLQSICGATYAFKCPGVSPPAGCNPGTLNTGYPYFCCPKAVYP